jgi:hypothetical protein
MARTPSDLFLNTMSDDWTGLLPEPGTEHTFCVVENFSAALSHLHDKPSREMRQFVVAMPRVRCT